MVARPFFDISMLAGLFSPLAKPQAQYHTPHREHRIASKMTKSRERRERRRRAEKRNIGNQFKYGVNWS
jgi:hypothetical protein